MLIKILASTNDEKGKLFEELMGDVLDGHGYTNLEFRQLRGSGELDITGYHKFSGQEILAECKAQNKPINKPKLKEFHSKYTLEHENRESKEELPLLGLFFSLSGFTGPACKYYDAMNENTKRRFRIFGYQEIVTFLRTLRLSHSQKTIHRTVEKALPYSISRCYLVKSPSGLHWVILFSIEGEKTHYAVVDGKGDIALERVYEEISNLDNWLTDKERIDLEARRKIILSLLDCSTKTEKAIAEASNESEANVRLELSRLLQENICDVEKQDKVESYKLRKDAIPFAQLSREFLETEDRGKFANSNYYCTMIDERLVDYVVGRFRLQMTDEDKEKLGRILLFSPSALKYCLYTNAASFEQSWSDLQRVNISFSDRERLTGVQSSMFLTNLLVELLKDIQDVEYGFLHKRIDVQAATVTMKVALATTRGKYVEEIGGGGYSFGQAHGKIRGGQLVTYLDPLGIANTGLAFHHLGEFGAALDLYGRVLKEIQDSRKRAMVLNNKGITHCALAQHETAIDCYDEAIRLDSEEEYGSIRFNKAQCLKHLGHYSEAIGWAKKALAIDPSWEIVKSFLAQTRTELQKSSQNNID